MTEQWSRVLRPMLSRLLSRPGSARAALDDLSVRSIAIRLFVTCWLIYALHFATNTVREIYPALSLGDHLSFDVSEYAGLHPDIFELPGRGTFINNNPGASIMGAVPYALARPVIDRIVARVQQMRAQSSAAPPDYASIYPMAREFYRQAYERGLDIKFGLAAGVMQAMLMAPLSALSAVVIFYILVSLTASKRAALLLSLLYAFATPVFYRTAQLNQNVLISHFALFGFALLWRPWQTPWRPDVRAYLLAGLCAGWAVVLDYSGMVALLFLSLYVLARHVSSVPALRSRPALGAFAVGVLVCAAVLMAYQWVSFGNPFLPAQRYMPATQYSGYGFNGMGLPQLDLLWDTAFGLRFGLFTSAPLLLVALYPAAWLRESIRLVGRVEAGTIAVFVICLFLFCSANEYGRLQFNSGVRYIVPAVPFLFLLGAGVLLRLPTVVAALIGIGGVYWSWCLAMYRDVEQGWGVLESLIHITTGGPRLPWLMTLERMGYGAGQVMLPLLLVCAIIVWWLWIGTRLGAGRRTAY